MTHQIFFWEKEHLLPLIYKNKYVKNLLNRILNIENVATENIKELNPHWPRISDHPNRVLLISNSGYKKANVLLYLKYYQTDIDKYTYTLKISTNQNIICFETNVGSW